MQNKLIIFSMLFFCTFVESARGPRLHVKRRINFLHLDFLDFCDRQNKKAQDSIEVNNLNEMKNKILGLPILFSLSNTLLYAPPKFGPKEVEIIYHRICGNSDSFETLPCKTIEKINQHEPLSEKKEAKIYNRCAKQIIPVLNNYFEIIHGIWMGSIKALEKYLAIKSDKLLENESKNFSYLLLDIALKSERPDLLIKVIKRGTPILPKHYDRCNDYLKKVEVRKNKLFSKEITLDNLGALKDLEEAIEQSTLYKECLELMKKIQ